MSNEQINPDYLIIGRVLRPHGVRGEIRVEVLADVPERFYELEAVYIGLEGSAPRLLDVESVRFHQDKALVKLEGYDDRSAAEELRGQLVQVAFEDAIPLEDGEFYLYQLIGMQVYTDEGEHLGELVETIQTGANDVFVVRGERGELLIPDTEEVVTAVDGDTRQITVHVIPGLL